MRTPTYLTLLFILLGTLSATSGATYYVHTGDNLQTFLNAAVGGDTLILDAGATFRGNFTLPKKQTFGWIYLRSSMESKLPAGRRVTPALAQYMPKIETAIDMPALVTAPGASRWAIIGMEIKHAPGVYAWSTVCIGYGNETSMADLPNGIVIDRSYIHGDPVAGGKRGVALNGRATQVTNSWISDYKHPTLDTQAIGGWGGPGWFNIVNNYLEATGENIMFGGAIPGIKGVIPSDIVIRGNDFFKPLSWRKGHPTYAGKVWSIKNHFELKNAARVIFDGNRLENNWYNPPFGGGTSILLTPRTEDGKVPWATVEDVAITNNIIINSGEGVRILGNENTSFSRRITIRNNIVQASRATNLGSGNFVMVVRPVEKLVVEHNTELVDWGSVYFAEALGSGLVYKNNISTALGNICADSMPNGLVPIAAASATVLGNIGIAQPLSLWPAGNWVVPSLASLGFTNPAALDYSLPADSPFKKKATDGTDPGVNMPALLRARRTAVL